MSNQLPKRRISRAQWWDYGNAVAYAITLVTKDRQHYFGEIKNSILVPTNLGSIADVLWHQLPHHHKTLELDTFALMPNHLHAIVILHTEDTSIAIEKPEILIPAHEATGNIGKSRFQNIGGNTLSSIIGSYKSSVTRHANRLGLPHAWQPRFYDRIIRDQCEHQRLAEYIRNNPINWQEDSLIK